MVDKSQQITLRDGRTLGCAEYGASEGVPIFCFHGFPGSRLDYQLLDPGGKAAAEANVRIVAVDRPGYGLSSPQRGRTILDWPDDVTALADSLGIDRFAVLGVSGGGPYAAACAFKIPGRLTAAGIVCGMGPADAPGMADGVSWTIPGKPGLMRVLILTLTSMGVTKDPEKFLVQSKETLSQVDRRFLERPDVAEAFVAGLQEAFRSGIGGAGRDAALYGRPWGFRLEQIPVQVHLWHGEKDKNVPPSVGRYVAVAIPHCDARFYPEEGHLTLPYNRIREILGALIA